MEQREEESIEHEMSNSNIIHEINNFATLGETSNMIRLQELQISLSLDDSARTFHQKCTALQRSFAQLETEYQYLEAELLEINTLMTDKKPIDECDLTDLRESLRKFRTEMSYFNLEGAVKEEELADVVLETDKMINTLGTVLNNIEAKVDLFDEELEDDVESVSNMFTLGIFEEIMMLEEGIQKLKTLMMKFKVPEFSFLTETLERQLAEVKTIHTLE